MSNFFINHYLQHSLRREISELYVSVAIKNFAFSMVAIFEPIYLYKIYNSISVVILYYAAVYTVYLFALPLGAKIASRYGFEHSMFYGLIAVIFYFAVLYSLAFYPWLIIFSVLLVVLYKSLFWPAYHADFAHYGNIKNRGKELSAYRLISSLAAIAGPFIGGLILFYFDFPILFTIVSIVTLASAIPLFTTREKFAPNHFSYRKSFERILKPSSRYKFRSFLSYAGFGENIVAVVIWPIFIFLLLDRSFTYLGSLTSMVALISIIASLYIGRFVDSFTKKDRKKLLSLSALICLFAWLMRPFVANWPGVLLVDTFSKGSESGVRIPTLSFVYNKGESRGFMNYVMFSEMSSAIGKMLIMWALFFVSLILIGQPLFWFWLISFVLAGIWSLLYLFL